MDMVVANFENKLSWAQFIKDSTPNHEVKKSDNFMYSAVIVLNYSWVLRTS